MRQGVAGQLTGVLRRTNGRLRAVVVGALIVIALVVGLAQAPSDPGPSGPPPTATALARTRSAAPPAIGRLYARGDALLRLDGDAFVATMGRLRGHPVLINKWASWCLPCRREFALLRRAAAKHGSTIAFLGLNAGDKPKDARAFLDGHPTIYPHVRDPDEQIAGAFQAGGVFPQTLIVDKDGDVTRLKAGEFTTEKDVEAFIAPYLRPSATSAKVRR